MSHLKRAVCSEIISTAVAQVNVIESNIITLKTFDPVNLLGDLSNFVKKIMQHKNTTQDTFTITEDISVLSFYSLLEKVGVAVIQAAMICNIGKVYETEVTLAQANYLLQNFLEQVGRKNQIQVVCEYAPVVGAVIKAVKLSVLTAKIGEAAIEYFENFGSLPSAHLYLSMFCNSYIPLSVEVASKFPVPTPKRQKPKYEVQVKTIAQSIEPPKKGFFSKLVNLFDGLPSSQNSKNIESHRYKDYF